MNNRILKFSINDQRIICDEAAVVADSRNYLTARFSFDNTWQGVQKTAVFSQGENTYNVVLVDDMCRVPAEVIKEDGFYVSVFGGDLITADRVRFSVIASGLKEGISPPEPTPSVYDQLLTLVAAENAAAANSADIAVAASEKATQSQKNCSLYESSVEEMRNETAEMLARTDIIDDAAEAVKKANNAAKTALEAAGGVVTIEQYSKTPLKFSVIPQENYDGTERPSTDGASTIDFITYANFESEVANEVFPTIANLIYPVGSIYMSTNSTSPATLFGGTWEQIKDRFLLSAGNRYYAGEIGGEHQHALSVAEIPQHNHGLFSANQYGQLSDSAPEAFAQSSGLKKTFSEIREYTDNTGRGFPHNNMPPYLTVYMWKRTA